MAATTPPAKAMADLRPTYQYGLFNAIIPNWHHIQDILRAPLVKGLIARPGSAISYDLFGGYWAYSRVLGLGAPIHSMVGMGES